MTIVDKAIQLSHEYLEQMPKAQRKHYGQFFTSKETALFMGSLLSIPSDKEELSILDHGAGSGILCVALIDRLQHCNNIKRVRLVCYETDVHVLELLEKNLSYVRDNASIEVSYRVVAENYIVSQALEYNQMNGAQEATEKFDLVIGNPPYLKIAKDAPEAKAMPDVCYGAPNLYFLFASMSLFNLKDDGEMVYIIPRSWTSGAYFTKFREKFLTHGALEHIHLFVSRDKVFDKESVLQETIILKVRKSTVAPKTVVVSSTQSNADFSHIVHFEAPYSTVVSGDAYYVYLVTNEDEVKTLKAINQWDDTLISLGLKMKTGLTVDFRNKDVLKDEESHDTVPMFAAHHLKDGKVHFPIGREGEFILNERPGLLQSNENYLFVKRFTSKEEHRRLQCAVYIARKYSKYKEISTQNKLNFICGQRSLSECVVYGLYVLFNSTLYDRYYRILNGSTQVNSTEINSVPVPPMSTIESMGKMLVESKDMSVSMCDKILHSFI